MIGRKKGVWFLGLELVPFFFFVVERWRRHFWSLKHWWKQSKLWSEFENPFNHTINHQLKRRITFSTITIKTLKSNSAEQSSYRCLGGASQIQTQASSAFRRWRKSPDRKHFFLKKNSNFNFNTTNRHGIILFLFALINCFWVWEEIKSWKQQYRTV